MFDFLLALIQNYYGITTVSFKFFLAVAIVHLIFYFLFYYIYLIVYFVFIF